MSLVYSISKMAEWKTNARALESQRKIYKALRRVLERKQLSEITVADVSEECGISRTTFYRNFNNIIDVLDVTFDFYYHRYLTLKEQYENQLLFFFEYWIKHRDLFRILAKQNESLIKKTIMKYEGTTLNNVYLLDIKYSLMTSIICRWSERKKETPAEMELLTRKILSCKCIDILIK